MIATAVYCTEADPLIPEDLTATTTGGLRTRNL
jgi:hypothetical protein